MKTCCICGTHWKDAQRENKLSERNRTLIYGCRKCQKGYWEKNNKRGDFGYGEFEKKKKNEK